MREGLNPQLTELCGVINTMTGTLEMDERTLLIQNSMYQYSRAIYRSIKDLVDPYVTPSTQVVYRRAVLEACEQTMERLARDPHYFAKPERSLFQDIRRYFPITAQAQVAWAVDQGVTAAVSFIEEQIEAGAFDGGVPRCHATTRKGKPCQRTPLPERDYCPSHQHLERSLAYAASRVLTARSAASTPAGRCPARCRGSPSPLRACRRSR